MQSTNKDDKAMRKNVEKWTDAAANRKTWNRFTATDKRGSQDVAFRMLVCVSTCVRV